MNLELVKARSRIVQSVRRWFDDQSFLEMITPRLVGLPGQEPYLDPFWLKVECPTSDFKNHPLNAALITSPEYAMKRLLAAGLDKIYDLGPCFRNNEPWDGSHDPEFLMLEWYRREAGIEELMDDTEKLMRWVGNQMQEFNVPIQQLPSASFRKLTVEDAWREYAGVELAPLLDNRDGLAKVASEKFSQTVTSDDTWDDIYFKIFLTVIEPKLGWKTLDNQISTFNFEYATLDPVFLYRYPASQASLARRCADDSRWAERVELYCGPYELANGFAELCDPVEQRARFEEESLLRSSLGKPTWPLDELFLTDLPKMGNAAGIAFGVERFVMLLTGVSSINDILPFSARERLTQTLS